MRGRFFGAPANQIVWEQRLIEALARIRDRTLLIQAGRGAARLIIERAMAAPRIVLGAAVVALVAGIGGNALLMQAARDPAPTSALSAQKTAALVEPVAARAPPAAQPAASAAKTAASQASAPATTASIGPAAEVDRPAAPQPTPAASNRVEKRSSSRPRDEIAALLRGASVDDGSRLVREAQVALAKLGYPVKVGGAEDGATRRALRHFQRAHGLPETAEISPELVKQLVAAAKTQR